MKAPPKKAPAKNKGVHDYLKSLALTLERSASLSDSGLWKSVNKSAIVIFTFN